ncbi:aminopeptidase N-like isoform X1 [Dermacentor andersoni]|uniref:aminopeptidase N-like isoform X1 n=1 Tax=Dermacentor andersoni TaxID=34620 RepID=UPI003B3A8FE8
MVRKPQAQGSEPRVNVKRVMRSWLKTPGYPLLTATRNYTTGTVSVKQQAYAPAGNTQNDTKITWNIPITYTSMSEKNFDRNGKIEWLNKREGKLKRKVGGGNKWLIVNIQRVGYYRVNYDIFNWRLLQSQLRDSPEAIHVLNRAQLIDDALDLAKNGHLPYEVALEFLDLVRPEDDYMPWKSALDAMHDLDFLIRKTKYYRKYQVFVRFLLERKFETFIQEKRSNLSIAEDLLRKAVIMNSCYFENEACLAFSTNKFRSFLNDSSKIQKALRKNPWRTMVVLCQGVRLDNGSHWQFVLDHLDEAAPDDSKRAAVRALGCARNRSRLKQLLHHTMDKPEFPGKMEYVFESLMETPVGEELASDFLMKNLKKLVHKSRNSTRSSLGVADFPEKWTRRLPARCTRPSGRCSGRRITARRSRSGSTTRWPSIPSCTRTSSGPCTRGLCVPAPNKWPRAVRAGTCPSAEAILSRSY